MTGDHDVRHVTPRLADGSIPDMSSTTSTKPESRTRGHLRFALHYVEMVVAMVVGMVALGPLVSWVAPSVHDRADVSALVMATNMSIGMAVWMRIRRHSWPRIAEMCAAMYVPFLVVLVPFWLGAVGEDAVMMVGHVLMMPAMLAVMIWRRRDYYHHHH
jgi:flagellar biosynthetic protein FliP